MEIWPFEIIQDGSGRHLEFVRTGNSAIRSAVPENPILEQNMKWIGPPVAEIWPFEMNPSEFLAETYPITRKLCYSKDDRAMRAI